MDLGGAIYRTFLTQPGQVEARREGSGSFFPMALIRSPLDEIMAWKEGGEEETEE